MMFLFCWMFVGLITSSLKLFEMTDKYKIAVDWSLKNYWWFYLIIVASGFLSVVLLPEVFLYVFRRK